MCCSGKLLAGGLIGAELLGYLDATLAEQLSSKTANLHALTMI
jgi:hypothetical protein